MEVESQLLTASETEAHEESEDTLHLHADIDNTMIPESEELARRNRLNIPVPPAQPPTAHPLTDNAGLIVPRKLANPCIASRGHQDLRRELLFNQKIGKSVVGQKSELQRALEKHKEHQERNRAEQAKVETQLEQIIHERARRLQNKEKAEEENGERGNVNEGPEFMQVHAKLRARMEPK